MNGGFCHIKPRRSECELAEGFYRVINITDAFFGVDGRNGTYVRAFYNITAMNDNQVITRLNEMKRYMDSIENDNVRLRARGLNHTQNVQNLRDTIVFQAEVIKNLTDELGEDPLANPER